jgi:dTDP-4-amino-4,6-dideoxygalactose transaminase
MIPVTKPFLPPKEEVYALLDEVWSRQWLTNNGPLVNKLELMLKEYLGVPHLLYLNNGTIALQIAIKALDLKGEIITTPFSYVATTSSIMWEGCTPVFVDIDEHTFNINPANIEVSITPNTQAILATHVFGNPCDIDAIQQIANKHNLKVIYDAAHCFGTTYKGKSVFAYGDVSTTSFHATKLFHTVEGGAVFCNSPELLKKMAYLRNFGHHGPTDFAAVGINGKNSEFHAAMGVVNLKYINQILAQRKALCQKYDNWLKRPNIQHPTITPHSSFNYAYYPVVFDSEDTSLNIIKELEDNCVTPRRYFYPSLNKVDMFKPNNCPISESIAKCILCLPLYQDLKGEDIDFICRIVLRTIDNQL